jgi:hypothetical protein
MTFEQREKQEREIILRWVNQTPGVYLSSTTKIGSYTPYDGAIISGDSYQKFLVEVKLRGKCSDDFDSTILEEKKVLRLKEYRDQLVKKTGEDIKIIHLAYYLDKYILIWDIDGYDTTNVLNCPVTSTGEDKGRIDKVVYEYYTNKAQKIKLKNE